MIHWPKLRRIVSRTSGFRLWVLREEEACIDTLEPSQTFFECTAYCSTTGRILVVTMR